MFILDKKKIFLSTFVFILFLFWYFLIGFNHLFEPFVGDDLHLIRIYSNEELINVWFNNWDPDELETAAYRPLAVLFYHLQALIFGEKVYLHSFFINTMQFTLIILITIFLKKLKLSTTQILTLIPLLLFSKIFITLSAWKTLSPLLFCYINFFFASLFFIKWMKKQKNKYLILIFLFSFISIFTREEVYHLSFFMILIGIYISKDLNFKILKKMIPPFIIVFVLTITHYFLRGYFVLDAAGLNITLIGIQSFLLSGLAVGLPGGVFTTSVEEKIFQAWWILSLIIMILTLYKFKYLDKLLLKKITIFFLITGLLTSPMLIINRDFGIFLPTIFSLAIISLLISKLLDLKKIIKDSKIKKILINTIIISIILSGTIGGYKRSKEHLLTWSHKSIYMISADSHWIYAKKNIPTIPLDRKKNKIIQLKKYDIENFMSVSEIKKNIKTNSKFSDIIIPNHFPLKY